MSFLLPMGILLAIGFSIYAAISTFSGYGATATSRRKNLERVHRAFDGSPEVKVPVHGAGMSATQTAWLGYQYGYSVSRYETPRYSPRLLVMRRTNTAVPPNTGVTPVWNTPPVVIPVEQIQEELRQAPDPGARSYQFQGLLVFGIAAAVEAVRNYCSGHSYVVLAVASVLFLSGAVVLKWYTWRANQRRRTADPQTSRPGPAADSRAPSPPVANPYPAPPPPVANPYMAPPPPGYGPPSGSAPPGPWPSTGQQPPKSP
ncbi:hypothetical protein [Streptomyces sp. CT34]|uniref:hypothetical protein n=1 Tax=Streptomyces sp. CT34 TaxID=1553907 RepID=UPI0012FE9EFA|nr:hypothetical protein [Streptomyces sp. CT34]